MTSHTPGGGHAGLHVRRMSHADLDAVVALNGSGVAEGWDRQAFADELANAISHPCVLVAGGPGTTGPGSGDEVWAYLMAWRVADEVQVLHIAVQAQRRQQGLATFLLRTALEQEHADGATGATLEVRRSNAAALALYHRLGFQVVGERRRYYQDGEDAVLMTLFLEPL